MDLTAMLPRNQAAQLIGVSPVRVDQLCREGRLPFTRTRLGKLIDPRDIEALRHERQVNPPRVGRRAR